MKKFLIILDFATGIAEVQNVGIIEADSQEEAVQKTITSNGLSPSAKRFVRVFDLTITNEDWWYFK